MLTIQIDDLQKKLKKPIKRNYKCLGLDIASRTGWALITTTKKELTLDYGFMSVDTKDHCEKFNAYIQFFRGLIKPDYKIVIEDCFFGGNPVTLKLLAKLEGIAYCAAYDNKVQERPIWIGASSARKKAGCKGNTKKPEVAIWIRENLGLKLEDEDAADAIILAICGIMDESIINKS